MQLVGGKWYARSATSWNGETTSCATSATPGNSLADLRWTTPLPLTVDAGDAKGFPVRDAREPPGVLRFPSQDASGGPGFSVKCWVFLLHYWACLVPPSSALLSPLWVGGFPYLNRLQQKGYSYSILSTGPSCESGGPPELCLCSDSVRVALELPGTLAPPAVVSIGRLRCWSMRRVCCQEPMQFSQAGA